MKRILSITLVLLSAIAGILLYSKLKKNKNEYIKKKKVYMDMDGNIDDLVAFLLLLNFHNIELVGITITPADCWVPDAKEFVSKIIHKKGLKVPIVASDVKPVNDFPDDFKQLTAKANHLPTLLNIEYSKENELEIEASEYMYSIAKKIFDESQEKLTLLITGPPSSFCKAMKNHPEIKNYIEEVFWMGGAIDVSGNVAESPYSEYNANWDPPSTKAFIESGIPIKMISLDSTNTVPIDKKLLTKLAEISDKYEAANLVNELFAIAYFIDPSGFDTYYAWDCLASMSLSFDDLITYKEAEVDVITKKNETNNQEGRIIKKEGSKHFVNYSQPLDSDSLQYFYDTFISTLKFNL